MKRWMSERNQHKYIWNSLEKIKECLNLVSKIKMKETKKKRNVKRKYKEVQRKKDGDEDEAIKSRV